MTQDNLSTFLFSFVVICVGLRLLVWSIVLVKKYALRKCPKCGKRSARQTESPYGNGKTHKTSFWQTRRCKHCSGRYHRHKDAGKPWTSWTPMSQ